MYHIRRNNKHIAWISVFVFASVLECTKAEVKHDNDTIITTSMQSNTCECIHYDCGCCSHINLHPISINGTICANVTYLEQDYGFSATLTYNNIVIINETLSARNPPPICIGEEFIEYFPVECCLRLYDIIINDTGFHCCFELDAKMAKLKILPLQLGCIDANHTNTSHASSSHVSNVYLSSFAVLLSFIMFK